MKRLSALAAILICGGIGWAVYEWSLRHAQGPAASPAKRPLAVEVIPVRTSDVVERVQLVGSLEAIAFVAVRSPVRGYVTGLPFDVGDAVRPGADEKLPVVVQLDDADEREGLSWNEAALRVARSQLESTRIKYELAASTLQRQQELERSGASTPQGKEQAAADFAIARAENELALARVAQVESDLARARIALEKTRIVAPLAGFVAQRYFEVGDLANPDDLLMELVDLSTVRTVVHVVEKDYEKVRVDQVATLRVDAFSGETFTGKVVRKAPVLDPATRTADVHVEIANPQGRLKPGMHARVSIVFDRRSKVPVVPVAALLERNEKKLVYIVTGDPPRTECREIEPGIVDGEYVEVIGGIDPEDLVVTLGSRIVEDGQSVTPIPAPETIAGNGGGTGDAVVGQ